jgi:group II intron reverse transcriptase/maturase
MDTLREAYYGLNRKAAPGVDGETWRHYGERLEENLEDLSSRLKRGAYRAKMVRRSYVPKEDGRRRPLGVTALEDKLAQAAFVKVLNAIYEEEFVGFSYGFRPKRSQHDALDALCVGIERRKVSWVLDADIRGFFDAIVPDWLVRFIEHRIADRRIVRLVLKWLNAGVLEEGKRIWSKLGTPQGGNVSPLLANIYLHYVFDLWAHQWRRKHAKGDVTIVRYADDFIVGFQHQGEAEQFLSDLRERFAKFGLELHPEKTRLIEFGRHAAERRHKRGLGKPETFNFLGFTHICGKSRKGKFRVERRTMTKRIRRKLAEVKAELKRRLHDPVPWTGQWLRSVLRGHYRYYGVPFNYRALARFRDEVVKLWQRCLSRRSQKGYVNWTRMRRLGRIWIPKPHICHPYPNIRFDVRYSRQEPSALAALAGICAGGPG